MRYDDGLRLPYLCGRKPDVDGQVYVGGEPKLGFPLWVGNMDVDSNLFSGEEKQSELSVADDSWCHTSTLAQALPWASDLKFGLDHECAV